MLCDSLPDASNQMQMDFGDGWMDEAREWCERNPDAWEQFKLFALDDSRDGYASAKEVAWKVRTGMKVSVNDKLVSSLARLAKEQEPEINFRFKKSRVDGMTTAYLG